MLDEAINLAIGRDVVSQIHIGDRTFDLIFKISQSDVDLQRIVDTPIRTPSGELLPLSLLAEFQLVSGPAAIYHENMQRMVLISCAVEERDSSDVESDIRSVLESVFSGVEDSYRRFDDLGFRLVRTVTLATNEAARRQNGDDQPSQSEETDHVSATKSVLPWPLPPGAPPPAIAPFATDEAKKHQQAWAGFLDLPVEKSIDLGNGETLTLVLIPPGEFLMGSNKAEQASFLQGTDAVRDGYVRERIPSEGPQHWARITRPFYLGKYEVTQRQWDVVMGDNPSHFTDNSSHPVEQIRWDDTQPFLTELNEICMDPKLTFILPTEAQWEYACRAGTTTMWHSGHSEVDLQDFAWFEANSAGRTHPVGQLSPNAFGLYDMLGNVWEWCADWYAADYYANSVLNDPAGCSEGEFHVRRGGAWRCRVWSCRSAVRHDLTEGWYFALGFRVVATIELSERPKVSGG